MQMYDKKVFLIMTPDKKYLLKGDRKTSNPKLISADDSKDKHKPSIWGNRQSAIDFLNSKRNVYDTSLVVVEAKYYVEV